MTDVIATTNAPKPYVQRLYDAVAAGMHRGEDPPQGYVRLSECPPATREMCSTLNFYFSLKVHKAQDFHRPPQCSLYHAMQGEDVWIAPDFKERVKSFFLMNRSFPEGRDNPSIYSELFARVDKFLKPPANQNSCTLWKEGDNKNTVAANELDLSKPTLVYCGGLIGLSEEEGYLYRAIRRTHRIMENADINENIYSINTLTYNNSMTISKVGYIFGYQKDPDHFHSPQADDFVQRFLRPHFTDAEGVKKPVDEVVAKFSNLRFLAYSYGTCFVSEVRNSLHHELREAGFAPQETKRIIDSVAALLIGSLVPVRDKSSEGDFVQLQLIDAKDEMAHARCNFAAYPWQKTAPGVKVAYHRQGNQLALYAEDVPFNIPQVHFAMPEVVPSLIDYLKMTPEEQEAVPDYVVHNLSKRNFNHHAVEGYLLSTRHRMDDDADVVEVNPTSHIGRKFISNAMRFSFGVQQQVYRAEELTRIQDRVVEYDLHPEKLSERATMNRFMLGIIQEAAAEGIKPPRAK